MAIKKWGKNEDSQLILFQNGGPDHIALDNVQAPLLYLPLSLFKLKLTKWDMLIKHKPIRPALTRVYCYTFFFSKVMVQKSLTGDVPNWPTVLS